MLVSGEGTNLQALLDDAVVVPHITVVCSDRPDAPALRRATAQGIEALTMRPEDVGEPGSYDRALRDLLLDRDVNAIVSAGFMRVLGPEFVTAFADRWLNVHPALLPSFRGATGIADALAWGVKVTGVTVHLVDEEVDHGPIVRQEAVAVRPDDDEASLAARIHEVEHRLLPEATRALIEGRLTVQGRHVIEEGP